MLIAIVITAMATAGGMKPGAPAIGGIGEVTMSCTSQMNIPTTTRAESTSSRRRCRDHAQPV